MAGHGEIKLIGGCVRDGCSRPARELGGHCTPHWMALTTAERAHLQWLRDIDDAAMAIRCSALDELFNLPSAQSRGRAA